MAWTLCTSGAAFAKSGLFEGTVLGAGLSGADLVNWSNESENIVCALVRHDVITNYATLTSAGKEIISNLTSNLIGQKIAAHFIPQFSSQREAETVLDVIENDIRKYASLLQDDKLKGYLGVS